MKVLFLDVDGVLNTHNSMSLYSLSKTRVKRLAEIVKETGCSIVVSSTWRRDSVAFFKLKRALSYHDVHIHDVTPYLGTIRGKEIADWLTWNDDVTTYAIVDDDSDMLEEQKPNLFLTTMEDGLTEDIANKIKEHLLK